MTKKDADRGYTMIILICIAIFLAKIVYLPKEFSQEEFLLTIISVEVCAFTIFVIGVMSAEFFMGIYDLFTFGIWKGKRIFTQTKEDRGC
jgi:hypothetical protein